MQYKTIILELIQQNETLHDRLRSNRSLLATVDRLAAQLKADHETYLNQMTMQEPTASRPVVSQQAFEMAIKEAQERLMAENRPSGATGLEAEPVSAQQQTTRGE